MTPIILANHVAQEKSRLLARLVKPAAASRIEWSRKEFAEMVGISAATLKSPKYYRRYGGKKRGGRIVFSAATVEAIRAGKL